MLAFLEHKLSRELHQIPEDCKGYFQEMYGAPSNANLLMRTIYHSSFWLSDEESSRIIRFGRKCLNHFAACAEMAYHLNLTRFKLQPKFHSLGEIIFEIEDRQKRGLPNVSPLVYCNQQDEDFVGRIATFSRSVASRTIHERTLTKYQISLASKWWHERKWARLPKEFYNMFAKIHLWCHFF